MERTLSEMSRTFSGQSGMKETYHCYVCQEMQPIGPESLTLQCCGHIVHRECWQGYLNAHIPENQGRVPTCFKPIEDGSKQCGTELAEVDIEALLEPEMFQKYKNFKDNLDNPDMRTCSKCGTAQQGSEHTLRMECINKDCNHMFCFKHGDACQMKEGEGDFETKCKNYDDSRDNATDAYLEKARAEGAIKPCPKCSADVTKNGGCNAMLCTRCKTGFCWLCGEEIQDAEGLPHHFAAWNMQSKCRGKQFEGMDGEAGGIQLSGCERRFNSAVTCLIIIVLCPFAIAMTATLCVLLCALGCILPFFPNCGSPGEEGSAAHKCAMCVTMGLFVVFLGIPLLLTSCIWGPWYCYLRRRIANAAAQEAANLAEGSAQSAAQVDIESGAVESGNTDESGRARSV